MKLDLKWTEKIGFFLIFVIVVGSVTIARTDLHYYQAILTREDGFIEWLTVIALVLGAMTSFYRAKILVTFRPATFILGLIVMGFIFLFGAGEEISWGQRIFDWGSPAFFHQYNTQGETNLHNLAFGGTKLNKLVFGLILGICIAFYFLVLPFLYRKFPKVKSLVDRFALPIPKGFHIIAYLILAGLAELIPGHKKGEILEFGGCWIFYMMTLEPFNRERFSRKSFKR